MAAEAAGPGVEGRGCGCPVSRPGVRGGPCHALAMAVAGKCALWEGEGLAMQSLLCSLSPARVLTPASGPPSTASSQLAEAMGAAWLLSRGGKECQWVGLC